MPYKNIKEVLVAAVQYPAAIEAKLPTGAPAISTMLLNAANQFPVVPDFPMEIPDMPPPPELPEMPTPPVSEQLRRYVTSAEVRPAPVAQPVTQVASNRYLF